MTQRQSAFHRVHVPDHPQPMGSQAAAALHLAQPSRKQFIRARLASRKLVGELRADCFGQERFVHVFNIQHS